MSRLDRHFAEYGQPPQPRTAAPRAAVVGERRICGNDDCPRCFTVTALLPKQEYCSFSCADRARGKTR